MEIVTFNYAVIQKVKSSFEFKNSISSIRNCNELQFFEPRFTSLYCAIDATKLTTDRHEASRGLFATAELLVQSACTVCETVGHCHSSTIMCRCLLPEILYFEACVCGCKFTLEL